jgi:hypothetical protein
MQVLGSVVLQLPTLAVEVALVGQAMSELVAATEAKAARPTVEVLTAAAAVERTILMAQLVTVALLLAQMALLTLVLSMAAEVAEVNQVTLSNQLAQL